MPLLLAISAFLLFIITPFQTKAEGSEFEIVNGVLNKYNGNDKTVTVPEGVTKIGDNAFMRSEISKVILPGSVTEIGKEAFLSSSVTEVSLSDGVTKIGKSAFRMSDLVKINLPDSITEIDEGAFEATNLAEITLPNSIKEIKASTFYGTDFTSIVIPDSVTAIGEKAFWKSNIKDITWSNNLKTIGNQAFSSCRNLTSVTLPDSVAAIGDYAFAECYSLKNFTIPAAVSSIGTGLFNESCLLTDIQVSSENPYFSSDKIMLYNKDKTVLINYPSANGVVTLPDGIVETAENVFEDSLDGTGVTRVIFPGTFKRLGDNTFFACYNLEEISLPSSLESFGKQSFELCKKLNTLTLSDTGEAANFVYEDGVLYNKEKTAIYLSFERNDIVIPDTITGIGSYAFPFVTGTVVVPPSVTTFGENIFVKDQDDDIWSDNRIIIYGYHNTPIEKYCESNPYDIDFLAFDGTFTIRYTSGIDSDNASFPDNPSCYTRNTKTFQLKKPTLPGYVFQYWYTTYARDIYGNYTKRYDDEYKLSKVSEIPKGSMGDINLIARWTKVSTAQAKITSAKKASATRITLNLKSVSGAKGYQIVYANNSAFTSGKKTVTTQSLKYGMTNLKKGKTYYIKVRAYKLDSCGKKVYGKYSTVSKVKL